MVDKRQSRSALSLKLTQYFRESGRTQADFAREVGCDTSALSRYVSGEQFPKEPTLGNILAGLGVSAEELNRSYLASTGQIDLDGRLTQLRDFYGAGGFFSASRVNIIASSNDLVSIYKDYTARNYIELDNYADRDAVFQLAIDLARCFPSAEVKLWKSADFSEHNFGDNIVLVGGPSFGKYTNNTVVDQFIRERRIPISADDTALIVDGERFSFEMNDDGSVHKDFSLIARFRNLLRPDRVVIAVMGHFSWGVTAAASAISIYSNPESFVVSQFDPNKDQILVFPVTRVFGKAVPDLSCSRVFEF